VKKAINLRLDELLLAELDLYASKLERTRTFLVEKAIVAYFDKLEAMLALQEAQHPTTSKPPLT